MSYTKVAQILRNAKDLINEELADNADASHHQLKIETALQREIDYISLLTGTADAVSENIKVSPPPATTMGGQPIKRPPASFTSEDLEPDQRSIAELKERVETLYPVFVTRDSKDILKTVDDTTIRGVAKKAHMKVTREDPETITLQFIEEIKDAIVMDKARQVAADEQREMGKPQPVEITEKELTGDGAEGGFEDHLPDIDEMTKSELKTSKPKNKKGE